MSLLKAVRSPLRGAGQNDGASPRSRFSVVQELEGLGDARLSAEDVSTSVAVPALEELREWMSAMPSPAQLISAGRRVSLSGPMACGRIAWSAFADAVVADRAMPAMRAQRWSRSLCPTREPVVWAQAPIVMELTQTTASHRSGSRGAPSLRPAHLRSAMAGFSIEVELAAEPCISRPALVLRCPSPIPPGTSNEDPWRARLPAA
jgi:hypothetical protein